MVSKIVKAWLLLGPFYFMIIQGTIVTVTEQCIIQTTCDRVGQNCTQLCNFAPLNAAENIVTVQTVATDPVRSFGKVTKEIPLSIPLIMQTARNSITYIPTAGKHVGNERKILFYLIKLDDTAMISKFPRTMRDDIDQNKVKNPWANYALFVFSYIMGQSYVEIAQTYLDKITDGYALNITLYPTGNFSVTIPETYNAQTNIRQPEQKVLINIESIE